MCQDATVYDEASEKKADILIADLPCSGLGVLGKKTDLKYKMNPDTQEELVHLQREILSIFYLIIYYIIYRTHMSLLFCYLSKYFLSHALSRVQALLTQQALDNSCSKK